MLNYLELHRYMVISTKREREKTHPLKKLPGTPIKFIKGLFKKREKQ